MTTYNKEQIVGALNSKSVSDFISRRGKGKCRGCGEEVPLNMDGDFIHVLSWYLEGDKNLEEYQPHPGFLYSHQHEKGACSWEGLSVQKWIMPENEQYSEEIASICEVFSEHIIVKKEGRYVLESI